MVGDVAVSKGTVVNTTKRKGSVAEECSEWTSEAIQNRKWGMKGVARSGPLKSWLVRRATGL